MNLTLEIQISSEKVNLGISFRGSKYRTSAGSWMSSTRSHVSADFFFGGEEKTAEKGNLDRT